MVRTMLAVTAVAVLGTAAPVAAATTGPSAAPRPATTPRTNLVVSYMADAGYAAAVTLTCHPAGGAHPKPAKACAALAKVSGKPNKLKPAPMMCTMEYAPITAQINGVWKGKKIKWSKTYPNSCDLARTTGVIFAF
jgi:hypothetical protein